MSEDSDLKEPKNSPPRLSHINLEQGEVLVRRIGPCLKQNPDADLYLLINFGAAPLETIVRELSAGDPNIGHLRITRNIARKLKEQLDSRPEFDSNFLKTEIGEANCDFMQQTVGGKRNIVLIDDIEHEGTTLSIAEALIRSFSQDCMVTKFPIIRSGRDIAPDDDEWPFALIDDLGVTKGYKMPWEENQHRFVGREVDPNARMKTNPVRDRDPLADSLELDLRKVTQYFLSGKK